MRDLAAGVSQAVRRAGRNDDDVARTHHAQVPAEAEAHLSGYPLEPLPLARVRVRRDEAPGPDKELSADATGRPLAKDDALPRHRVGDCVYALLDHLI